MNIAALIVAGLAAAVCLDLMQQSRAILRMAPLRVRARRRDSRTA